MNFTFSHRRASPAGILVLGLLAGTLVADADEMDLGVPPTPAPNAGERLEPSSSGQNLPDGENYPVCIPPGGPVGGGRAQLLRPPPLRARPRASGSTGPRSAESRPSNPPTCRSICPPTRTTPSPSGLAS